MYDPDHYHPPFIIANYLAISAIEICHEDDFVLLQGFYGDTADGYSQHFIEIESTFEQLNTLLTGLARGSEFFRDYAARAEEVTDRVAEVLIHPGGETDYLDFFEEEPLEFYEHVFSLALIHELVDGQFTPTERSTYVIRGFTRRSTGWPIWADAGCAQTKEEEAAYLSRLPALRYGLFLAYDGKVRRSEALIIACLFDQQLFTLAKVQYELLMEAVKERPEEYE